MIRVVSRSTNSRVWLVVEVDAESEVARYDIHVTRGSATVPRVLIWTDDHEWVQASIPDAEDEDEADDELAAKAITWLNERFERREIPITSPSGEA